MISDSPSVTFSIGQVVPWPPAPLGMAQVADLRRTRVMLCYPTKKGKIKHPIITARELAQLQTDRPLLFQQLHNLYNRGIIQRRKSFVVSPPPIQEGRINQ